MDEEDIMEECAEQLRDIQRKLESLPSKEERWNQGLRDEIDGWVGVLVI